MAQGSKSQSHRYGIQQGLSGLVGGTSHPFAFINRLHVGESVIGESAMSTSGKTLWVGVVRSMARLMALMVAFMFAGITAAQAAEVTLKVVAARNEPARPAISPACVPSATQICKGTTVVANYKFLINKDNTGQTIQRSPAKGTGCSPQDAGYPNSCMWTSIAGAKSNSPVYTQGSDADLQTKPNKLSNLPNGRYLVSVLADGYKLDGRHFTVSGTTVTWEGKAANAPASEVLVELQPTPLPDAQIQAAVFEDISPVNSAPDLPAEHGLAGFQGHILDVLGEVTTNVYGDPLCTKYAIGADGKPDTNAITEVGGRCLSACYVVNNGVDVGTVAPVDAAGRCPVDVRLADGSARPMLEGGTVPTGAAIEGKVKIPNLGPNRYTLSVTPPDGSGWIQTTTLEGNHDWDAWVMEGATGLDTEFIIAGEPFPAIVFGYTPAPGTPSAVGSALVTGSLGGSATIKGVVTGVKIYVPTTGGVPGLPGEIWGGLQGAVPDKPIAYPWVTLTNLGNGDTIVWAGQGDVSGLFNIPNVKPGTYTLTWWDEPQNTILDLVNVTVGETDSVVDMGVLPLSGWWTFLDGYVFNDLDRNGVRDPGEPGIPGYTLTMRRRDNSLMDRGTTLTTTDANGYYKFEAGYPMTQWLVMEAYNDSLYTTGITYQADNQPTPTTVLGAGVDVSVLPIIGLSGRLDWGKHTYDATGANGIDPRNGGIVGTVSYDTTRNELDPRYAAVEDWQPSVSDLVMKLYAPMPAAPGCIRQNGLNPPGSIAPPAATCDPTGRYAVAADGSLLKGPLLNTYVTETWERPKGCVARGADGTPLVHGVDENVLAIDAPTELKDCIEAPLMGVQFASYATDQGKSNANFGATVDGNYGFGDGCFAPNVLNASNPAAPVCLDSAGNDAFAPLPGGRDYLVQVDLSSLPESTGAPIYKVTREEDINIGNGDQFIPAVPPSACAGALHEVDVKDLNKAGLRPGDQGYVKDDGPFATDNPNYPGASPYEGKYRPLCDVKLVTLSNGKSIAPAFNVYTDVPIPGRHWFIVIDDLNFSSNPQSITFGEKAGMPFVPVGIYDYTDRLIKTVESDYNGLVDVLLPSTNRINCPTPSGVCGNLYRYVGNDPGVPGRLNTNFNPLFRTISAEFEVLPGQIIPADLAPTQVGVTVQLPGGQTTSPVQCKLDDATPQIYAVSRPYVTVGQNSAATARTFTINGSGFGASGTLYLAGSAVATKSWTNTRIEVEVAPNLSVGPKRLSITAANGQSTVNGLTLHVIGQGYRPQLYEVGPSVSNQRYRPAERLPAAADHAIQNALDDAARYIAAEDDRDALVVVYPNNRSDNPRQNPRGAYYENLIITSRVKLQGVGPGAPDGSVQGSIIDGGAFAGDSPVATDWYTRIGQETNANGVPIWGGNTTIYDGAVISIYVPSNAGGPGTSTTRRRAFPTANNFSINTLPLIDGFDLRGGDQQGFPGNINAIGGAPTGQPGGLITQGGAIFANAYARNLRITNNVVQANGGAYGTIRIGTPDLPAPDSSNHNESVYIGNNRIIGNAGTNQAGGIGLFNGSNNYVVQSNDICGNFSAEYGGGVSAVGYSPDGSINNNRIYFNRSFDEGGGIMIAGALPANTTSLSPGSGPVSIYNNLIQANLANDDGGGIRFLMAGNYAMEVYNNFIVNNISTHEGGGIALNDTPNVRFVNNTVMKNLTTATAVTSNGLPAPAGLSTSVNSTLLQATLPGGSPTFSNPLLFNNIFWDNRAGTRAGATVTGLSATAPDYWDLGVADSASALLSPTNSVIQQAVGTHPYTDVTTGVTANKHSDPGVVKQYDVGVTFNSWRNNPAFLGAILISADLPPNLMGDYHLASGSTAINGGAATKATRAAPTFDIDNQTRTAAPDIGADEYAAAAVASGSVAPAALGFGDVIVGFSATQTITLSNTGTAALTSINVAIVGQQYARPTGAAGGTCGTTLAGPGTCTINVVFTPTATGTAAGTVTVTGSVAIAGSSVALLGNGVPPPALPTLSVLDSFTRNNANNLGANWSQVVIGGAASTRVNNNQALGNNNLFPSPIWNAQLTPFGPKQGASITFANAPVNGTGLILKASGGAAALPANYVSVIYQAGQVIVRTTTNFAVTTVRGSFAATLAQDGTLTAVANANGSVDVWVSTTSSTTYLGNVVIPTTGAVSFTGIGRIGITVPTGARVDNFAAGSL